MKIESEGKKFVGRRIHFSHGHILLEKLLNGYALILDMLTSNLHTRIYANKPHANKYPAPPRTRNKMCYNLLWVRSRDG